MLDVNNSVLLLRSFLGIIQKYRNPRLTILTPTSISEFFTKTTFTVTKESILYIGSKCMVF